MSEKVDNDELRVKVQGYVETCRSYARAHGKEADNNPRSNELFEEEYVRSRRAQEYHRGGAEAFERVLEEVFYTKTPKAPPALSFTNDSGTQITRPRIGGGSYPEIGIGGAMSFDRGLLSIRMCGVRVPSFGGLKFLTTSLKKFILLVDRRH